MSIRPRLGVEVPALTAQVARASNPAVRRRCGSGTGWMGCGATRTSRTGIPRDGRPGLSPAQLATVCVLQFLLDLSDRAGRRGGPLPHRLQVRPWPWSWTIPASITACWPTSATGWPQDGRADRLLDLALARLKEAGLVRERSRQRTDSTHVLAAVRDLTRLELVTEAMRAALEELARTARHVLTGLVTRTGPPLRPAGPSGQEPHQAQDPDQARPGRTSACSWSTWPPEEWLKGHPGADAAGVGALRPKRARITGTPP